MLFFRHSRAICGCGKCCRQKPPNFTFAGSYTLSEYFPSSLGSVIQYLQLIYNIKYLVFVVQMYMQTIDDTYKILVWYCVDVYLMHCLSIYVSAVVFFVLCDTSQLATNRFLADNLTMLLFYAPQQAYMHLSSCIVFTLYRSDLFCGCMICLISC